MYIKTCNSYIICNLSVDSELNITMTGQMSTCTRHESFLVGLRSLIFKDRNCTRHESLLVGQRSLIFKDRNNKDRSLFAAYILITRQQRGIVRPEVTRSSHGNSRQFSASSAAYDDDTPSSKGAKKGWNPSTLQTWLLFSFTCIFGFQ